MFFGSPWSFAKINEILFCNFLLNSVSVLLIDNPSNPWRTRPVPPLEAPALLKANEMLLPPALYGIHSLRFSFRNFSFFSAEVQRTQDKTKHKNHKKQNKSRQKYKNKNKIRIKKQKYKNYTKITQTKNTNKTKQKYKTYTRKYKKQKQQQNTKHNKTHTKYKNTKIIQKFLILEKITKKFLILHESLGHCFLFF